MSPDKQLRKLQGRQLFSKSGSGQLVFEDEDSFLALESVQEAIQLSRESGMGIQVDFQEQMIAIQGRRAREVTVYFRVQGGRLVYVGLPPPSEEAPAAVNLKRKDSSSSDRMVVRKEHRASRQVRLMLMVLLILLAGMGFWVTEVLFEEQGIEWVWVEGGTFEMGFTSEQSVYDDEKPVHTVYVDGFYMSKYEVTFAQYDQFCEATGRVYPDDFDWGRGNRPVIDVSWYDAVEFCNWLSNQLGLEPCYTIDKTQKDSNNKNDFDDLKWTVYCDFNKNGVRLPTEAEWEYAARGGQKSRHYKKYAGSNNVDEVAWYYGNSGGHTHEVGTKQPNELGLYDMSGNVLEWCWDWYDREYYSSSQQYNPRGPAGGSYRVLRGGSWGYDARDVRVAVRYYDDPSYSYGYDYLGFRLVRKK